MTKTLSIASLIFSISITITAVFSPSHTTLAQVLPGHDHHHMMVGIDGRTQLSSGIYAGLDITPTTIV